ncbi:DMT family transporter [Asticcacaulis benevestitus]|uniref:EamA domain-containing protein n=1 Tax=Asticcacaulis benevestitus DSM 16100 = ATCC BAA-896 TaxID=1121022 RepID=V4NXG9_9CAUL|nr:DMT family transporter [Asticcacaulis benevestitus]ESQ86492.1 hypothetical protein ABENE_18385 [Asticcacaulis benevestitus DSM 16100 = ATCC BAA-896]
MGRFTVFKPIIGPVLGLAAYSLYSLGDASIRGIGTSLPPFELAFVGAVVSLMLSPLVLGRSLSAIELVRPHRWWRWLLRGCFAVGGTVSGIYAWSRLPLAEAAAILFLAPLLTSTLIPFCLREKTTLLNWLASLIGFLGVLIVLRPGLRELNSGHLAALVCALCGAGTGLLLHATRDEESAASMYGASALSVLAISGIAAVSHWVSPSGSAFWLIVAYASCGALANVVLMYAWRRGPAFSVASTQYSQLLWSIGLGFVFFSETPDVATRVGVTVIALAGIWPLLKHTNDSVN